MSNVNDSVAVPSATQDAVAKRAALPRCLMGGTAAMRQAEQLYLPKEEAESREAYKARVARSFLFNAFAKTVSDMTGKIFAKPIILKEDVPAQLVQDAENIDLAGRHVNVFARDVFYDALQVGVGYIWVDVPKRPEGLPQTVAAEATAGIRPYCVYIPAERLLGWKSSLSAGGEVLTQVRILETVVEPNGEFQEQSTDQVRVLEPGTWRVFRQNDKKEWVLYEGGTTSLQKITIVPVYTNRTGFMIGEPPLEKLAELNVAHWQSQSDQRNILHVARVPILFGAGFSDTEDVTIGASNMFRTADHDAKLTYVEHTGAAINSGDKDLQNLEFQMQNMGLQLLVSTPGQKTATGEIRDDSKENSPLAMMAGSLGDALEQAFGYMAEYRGLAKDGDDAGGSIEVNTDYGVQGGIADLQWLTQAVIAGKLDDQTYIEELKRRGTLGESVDPETVASRTAAATAAAAPVLDSNTPLDVEAPPAPGPNKNRPASVGTA